MPGSIAGAVGAKPLRCTYSMIAMHGSARNDPGASHSSMGAVYAPDAASAHADSIRRFSRYATASQRSSAMRSGPASDRRASPSLAGTERASDDARGERREHARRETEAGDRGLVELKHAVEQRALVGALLPLLARRPDEWCPSVS